MSRSAASARFLNPSRDGDSTTALGSLVQHLNKSGRDSADQGRAQRPFQLSVPASRSGTGTTTSHLGAIHGLSRALDQWLHPPWGLAQGRAARQLLPAPRSEQAHCRTSYLCFVQEGGNKRDAARGRGRDKEQDSQEGKRDGASLTCSVGSGLCPACSACGRSFPSTKSRSSWMYKSSATQRKVCSRVSSSWRKQGVRLEEVTDRVWLARVPWQTRTRKDPRQTQLGTLPLPVLQVPLCAGPPHCQEHECSQGHSSLEHKAEGKLRKTAKDTRLLK